VSEIARETLSISLRVLYRPRCDPCSQTVLQRKTFWKAGIRDTPANTAFGGLMHGVGHITFGANVVLMFVVRHNGKCVGQLTIRA
jgi:hypothetical protein